MLQRAALLLFHPSLFYSPLARSLPLPPFLKVFREPPLLALAPFPLLLIPPLLFPPLSLALSTISFCHSRRARSSSSSYIPASALWDARANERALYLRPALRAGTSDAYRARRLLISRGSTLRERAREVEGEVGGGERWRIESLERRMPRQRRISERNFPHRSCHLPALAPAFLSRTSE